MICSIGPVRSKSLVKQEPRHVDSFSSDISGIFCCLLNPQTYCIYSMHHKMPYIGWHQVDSKIVSTASLAHFHKGHLAISIVLLCNTGTSTSFLASREAQNKLKCGSMAPHALYKSLPLLDTLFRMSKSL